jgi:hypothetical protein
MSYLRILLSIKDVTSLGYNQESADETAWDSCDPLHYHPPRPSGYDTCFSLVIDANTYGSTSKMHVVQEIVDQIIAQLSPDTDVTTLSACALVNHSFFYASRRVLLTEMCLSPNIQLHCYTRRRTQKSDVIRGVEAIFNRTPELKHVTRRLYLDITSFFYIQAGYPERVNGQAQYTEAQFAEANTLVFEFLRNLLGLRNLLIFGDLESIYPSLIRRLDDDTSILPQIEDLAVSVTFGYFNFRTDWFALYNKPIKAQEILVLGATFRLFDIGSPISITDDLTCIHHLSLSSRTLRGDNTYRRLALSKITVVEWWPLQDQNLNARLQFLRMLLTSTQPNLKTLVMVLYGNASKWP